MPDAPSAHDFPRELPEALRPEPMTPVEIQPDAGWVLVLGATGYVGGRLVPRLLQAGFKVRAASRSIAKLQGRAWATAPEFAGRVQLAAVDALKAESLQNALQGCESAYYLLHSMDGASRDFAEADRQAARNMAQAAAAANLKRMIYLSGLGDDDAQLSKHLKSRTEVGEILQTGAVPVTVLRAAMIIGSGSASFEILRYLVERLPVMITPRWLNTPCQPIGIRNVLDYLIGCLKHPETTGQTYDIGCAEVVTYRELMQIYAEEAHLPPRMIIPLPLFTPRLSSYWIHVVTPVPSFIARPLAEGLRNPVLCRDSRIREVIPQKLLTVRDAIKLALYNMHQHSVETHWTDAGFLPPVETPYPGDPDWAGGTWYQDRRRMRLQGDIGQLWQTILRIGGETGWYYGDWMWHLRGVLDKLFGGVGHRRGRRNPQTVMPGDALDFWRVLNVEPRKRLRLLAEMKLPGQGILTFQLEALENDALQLTQTASFAPRGLSGILYWYGVSPLHDLVFDGMLKGIARASGLQVLQGPRKI